MTREQIDFDRARFGSTRWSLVLAARNPSAPDSVEALEKLIQIYWYPLYAFARRRGRTAEQAEDATQAFFTEVLEKQYLKSADPDRGRFRSFLLTMFKRFMSTEAERNAAVKRGGGSRTLSIDFPAGEQRYLDEPEDPWTAEKLYERRWALTLLETVLGRLRESYRAKGKGELFEHASIFLSGESHEQCYADVAAKLQMTPGNLRVAVHRMRGYYRELLVAEVAQTLEDPSDSQDELHRLRSAIRGES